MTKISRLSLKAKLVVGASVVAAIAAVGGYAYFSSSGSTTATGTVGTDTAWTLTAGSIVGTLTPGANAAAAAQGVVTGAKVTNASTTASQRLNTVVATITSVTSAAGGGTACAPTDFQVNSPLGTWTGSGTQTASISPATTLAPVVGVYNIADLNVAMVDLGANQDRCKGQTLTVTLTAS